MDVKIAKTAGFCWGVRRTVDKVMEVADRAAGPVVTLGPIIHNPQAVARMREKGVGTVGLVSEVGDGTTVVVRTHGAVIEVQCIVHPPMAEIVVADDGAGMGSSREDSHGMEIMAERARLVAGEFTVVARQPHGTIVTVSVGHSSARTDMAPALGPITRRKSAGSGRVLQP